MEQARHVHLEAATRLEDQWEKQRRDAAEREWLEHEAATRLWEAQMREAGYHPTHRAPAGPPPMLFKQKPNLDLFHKFMQHFDPMTQRLQNHNQ